MTRADRIARIEADLRRYSEEHEALPLRRAPHPLRYLAERLVEDEVERARIAGFPPAWLEEAKRT